MPEGALPRGYILAFDYGLRRIGVAVGQTTTCTASALETVRNARQPNWAAIDRLVNDWKPELMLVGLPLGARGEETEMSRMTRRFAAVLGARYSSPIEFVDERLTSRAAENRFADLRATGALRRKNSDQVDSISAQIILENWLKSAHA